MTSAPRDTGARDPSSEKPSRFFETEKKAYGQRWRLQVAEKQLLPTAKEALKGAWRKHLEKWQVTIPVKHIGLGAAALSRSGEPGRCEDLISEEEAPSFAAQMFLTECDLGGEDFVGSDGAGAGGASTVCVPRVLLTTNGGGPPSRSCCRCFLPP